MMFAPRSLAASTIAISAAAGAALVAFPQPGGLFTGAALALGAVLLTGLRDTAVESRRAPVAAAAAPVRPRTVVTRREPVRELTREPDPIGAEMALVPPFKVPEIKDLPAFVRQAETEHVFAVLDRVEFTLADWDQGETTYEGVIAHVYGHDIGYKVLTDDGAKYYAPVGCVRFVGDR